MKKYKIPYSVICVEIVLNILTIIIFVRILFLLQLKEDNFVLLILMIVIMTLLEIVPFAKSMIKKSVILNDDYISFCSFHINGKFRDVCFSYTDINALSIKRTLNLKMIALRIDINDCAQPLLIDATFSNHKELYLKIYENIQIANPSVYVDKKLIEYLNSN